MSEIEDELIYARDDGVTLRRMRNEGMPVLLLHGASARSETFEIPKRDIDKRPRSLKDWLWEQGFEPWLLDWCGSAAVVKEALKNNPAILQSFHLDRAAKTEIPRALEKIREVRRSAEGIGAIGHCLGGGALAQAVASGEVTGEETPRLTHVVLLTLGLFYIPPTFWGVLKAQDRPLERLWHDPKGAFAIDPHQESDKWPVQLKEIYQRWFDLTRDLPHRPDDEASEVCRLCNRLSFMYGQPYKEDQLVYEIHDDTWTLAYHEGTCRPKKGWLIEGEKSGAKGILLDIEERGGSWQADDAKGVLWLKKQSEEEKFQVGEGLLGPEDATGEKRFVASVKEKQFAKAELPKQFGAIPLAMYRQAARNVVRGKGGVPKGLAGEFDDDDLNGVGLVTKESRAHFRGLVTTLITGKANKLWHRRSVDTMYEWLRNDPHISKDRCQRKVLAGYGHQDLLWGRSARDDVFPEIKAALQRWVKGAPSSSPSRQSASTHQSH